MFFMHELDMHEQTFTIPTHFGVRFLDLCLDGQRSILGEMSEVDPRVRSEVNPDGSEVNPGVFLTPCHVIPAIAVTCLSCLWQAKRKSISSIHIHRKHTKPSTKYLAY